MEGCVVSPYVDGRRRCWECERVLMAMRNKPTIVKQVWETSDKLLVEIKICIRPARVANIVLLIVEINLKRDIERLR